MKMNRTLLKLLRQGAPANDLNFAAGKFPAGLSFIRSTAATVFTHRRKGEEFITTQNLGDARWNHYLFGNWYASSPSGSTLTTTDGDYGTKGFRKSCTPNEFYRFSLDITAMSGSSIDIFVATAGSNGVLIDYFCVATADRPGEVIGHFSITDDPAVELMEFVLKVNGPPGTTATFANISVFKDILGELMDPIEMVPVGKNVPRIWFDPDTGICRGLLQEPYGVNLITNSTNLRDKRVWHSEPASVNPVGLGKGEFRVENLTSPSSRLDYHFTNHPAANAGAFVYSVELKGSGTINISLNTTSGTSNTEITVYLTDKWVRHTVKHNFTSGDTGHVRIHAVISRNGDNPTVMMRYPQVESALNASSYIPTSVYSLGRQMDRPTWAMPESLQQNTFLVEALNMGARDTSILTQNDSAMLLEGDIPAGNDGAGILVLMYGNLSTLRLIDRIAGWDYYFRHSGDTISPGPRLMGAVVIGVDSKAYAQGGVPATKSGIDISNIYRGSMTIGHRTSGALPFQGFIERIRRWKRPLSVSELQYLTSHTEKNISEIGQDQDLDFTLGSLPPGVSFSRASSATVIAPKDGNIFNELTLVTVPAETPRFQYDENSGECLGLLVEPQRTNRMLISDSLGAFYFGTGSSAASAAADPFGGNTASLVTMIATGDWSFYFNSTGLTPGAWYTYSVWVKLGTAKNFVLGFNDTSGWDTLMHGLPFTVADGLSTTKYKRISHSFQAPGNGQVNLHLGFHHNSGPQQTPGTVFLFGHQFEEGRVATSYIRTTGSQVTRAADNPSVQNKASRAPAYTFFVDFDALALFDAFTPLGSINTPGIVFHPSVYGMEQPGVVGYSYRNRTNLPGRHKLAGRFQSYNYGVTADGEAPAITNSGYGVPYGSPIQIGTLQPAHMLCRNVKIFSRPLSDLELQVLTTLE